MIIILRRMVATLLAMGILFSSGCSLFSKDTDHAEEMALPELDQGEFTEDDILDMLGSSAYIPLDMEGAQAYRVVEDFLYLQYFTPSPFYTSQSPNAFNTLLDQRAVEAFAMGTSLGNDVEELLDTYISLGEAAAAVLNELTEGYNAQEEYTRESGYYSGVHTNIAWDINYYLYNTNAYRTAAADWRDTAGEAAVPFRKSQAEYFHVLHSMRAALELLEGFERVAIQARGLVAVCPGTASEGELLHTLDVLAADERIPALAAKNTALLQGIANAYEGNQQQALSILGERMHIPREPGEEVWADMDALSYKLLYHSQMEDGIYGALPEYLRPVSANTAESTGNPNAATRMVATPLEQGIEANLPVLKASYALFWEGQLDELAQQLGTYGREEGLRMLWQAFADDYGEDNQPSDIIDFSRPMDAVIPAAAAVDFYEMTWNNYMQEKDIAPLLAQEYRGLEGIVAQSGQMLSALSETAQGVAPTSTLETPMAVPLVYTPQQYGNPRVEEMAAVRFYVDGVAFTDMSLVQMVNLVTGSLPVSGGTAGIDFAAHSYLYQSMWKISDPNDKQELERVKAMAWKTMAEHLGDWLVDMLTRNGYNLTAFNIEMVVDYSDPIDPNPPKTVGIDRSAFDDYMAAGYEVLDRDTLKNMSWTGTMTLRRVEFSDYEQLYAGYMAREVPPGFASAGITELTYEMAHAFFEAMRDAATMNETITAELSVASVDEIYGEYLSDSTLESMGMSRGDTVWKFETPDAVMKKAGIKNVYVEEIRSTVQIYYGQDGITQNSTNLVFANGAYRLGDLEFLPHIDDSTGETYLTGTFTDVQYIGNGSATLYWEVNMTGPKIPPKTPPKEGGPICSLPPPGEPPPEEPPEEPPPGEPPPEEPPEEPPPLPPSPPSKAPNPVNNIEALGRWEGRAIITSSYGDTGFDGEKLEELREAGNLSGEHYAYLEQLLQWQEEDQGVGVRRGMVLDVLPEYEGQLSLTSATASREGAPDTDFLLRTFNGINDNRTIDSKRCKLYTTFALNENGVLWERFYLDLYAYYNRSGKACLTGTMTWTSGLTGRTIVYDVYLEKTGDAGSRYSEEKETGRSDKGGDESEDREDMTTSDAGETGLLGGLGEFGPDRMQNEDAEKVPGDIFGEEG